MNRILLFLFFATAARAEFVITEISSGDHTDIRLDRLPAIFVPEGQPPSPFLDPGPFEATFTTKLNIEARQEFTFELRGTGKASLRIGDNEIVSQIDEAKPVTLSQGEHEVRIDYQSPAQGAAQLRWFWKSTDFGFEPVPARVLGPPDRQVDTSLREARIVLAHNKCIACHQTEAELVMPELLEKGPSLTGAGSRLTRSWMAAWIADPEKLRPGTHMPAVFRGKEAKEKAAHIASYLAGSQTVQPSPVQGDRKNGGHLFQQLGCYACHSIHETTADRVPLKEIGRKFQPGALAAFLRAPGEHYADTPMPDFQLSETESNDLAAFLRSLGSKPESGAPEGDPDVGKQLLTSSGCLNCHDMKAHDSTLKTPGLAEILRSDGGCLDSGEENSPAPRFHNDLSPFTAAKAESDAFLASLGRRDLAEYAQRQFKALNCAACHSRDGNESLRDRLSEEVAHLVVEKKDPDELQLPQTIPALDHPGHKLRADWVEELITGGVTEKTRPWLHARMPAWPSRAENLATGFAHEAGVSEIHSPVRPETSDRVETGEKLVGITGFTCGTCHAIGDQKALAVFEGAGPNLALATERLRPEFYHQWMHYPQRFMPGTIMPRYAVDGVSPLTQFYGGDADQQFEAIYDYLKVLNSTTTPGMEPGLIGEYYKLEEGLGDTSEVPTGARPFLVRVDQTVNFPNTTKGFYGAKLSDQFLVRWSGRIQAPESGKYTIHIASDDGSRIHIGGKPVLDFWGPHSFAEKSAEVELTAGIHEVELVFMEIGGGQGCILSWTPPGGEKEVIPARNLSHASAELASIDWDPKPWKSAKGIWKPESLAAAQSGEAIPEEYGSLIGAPIKINSDQRGDNVSFRGHVVRLDDEGLAGVVFDTDTMRLAGAWLEGGLKLEGLPFTGGHGAFPNLQTKPLFSTGSTPGWANSEGSFEDPRSTEEYPPLGHLPKDWAHYKGLYRHGDEVVFHYTVGETGVMEHHDLIESGELKVISRLLEIQPHENPLAVALADAPEGSTLVDERTARLGDANVTIATGDGELSIEGQQARLRLPAADAVYQIEVLYWPGENPPPAQGRAGQISLASLTAGGPARWPEILTTQGELAAEDDANPYVLDRITLPYQNPWKVDLRVGGFDFFEGGTAAALSTWDGDVWIVRGIDDTLENLEWKRFASGIHEPLGLKIVDDIIYTVSDDQLTRYHDFNNDGEADYYENFNNDWELTSGFHAFLFDLHTDPEGNFVFAFGSPVRGGGRSFERMGEHHGSILKVSPDGSQMRRYASGFRAPNGIGVGPTGQITSGDNEGTFIPRCPINWVEEGGFYGVVDSYANRDELKTTATKPERTGNRPQHLESSEMPKPLAWLPKNVDNSGGGQTWVTSDHWGPFEGALLHGSYGQSSLYVVLKEEVGGQIQGGVVKIPVRPTSSVMRLRFNDRDGQLYLTGLKGWQSNAGRNGGFDRVRYTGKPVAMPSGLRIQHDGLKITFTEEIDPGMASDPGNYSLRGSDIHWSHGYGSKEYLLGQRDTESGREEGWTNLKVTGARLLEDRKTVYLTIEDMQPAHQMELNVNLKTKDGRELRTKVNHTVHVVPDSK